MAITAKKLLQMSDEVEKHPIGCPRRRGIGGSNLHESDLEAVTA